MYVCDVCGLAVFFPCRCCVSHSVSICTYDEVSHTVISPFSGRKNDRYVLIFESTLELLVPE